MSTDELKDLTGIADRLIALQLTVVLEGRALRVPVRVTGRCVERIERPAFVDEEPIVLDRQFLDQAGDDAAPRLLTRVEVQRLRRFLRRLVRREAGPLVSAICEARACSRSRST